MLGRQQAPSVPDSPRGRHEYAMETLELANSNFANVGKPWRFKEWFRIDRLVRARHNALKKALHAKKA